MTSTAKSSLIVSMIGLVSGGFAAVAVISAVVAVAYLYPSSVEQVLHLSTNDAAAAVTQNANGSSPSLTSNEDRIVTVVDKVKPAVVSVVASADVPVYEQYYQQFDPFNGGNGGDPSSGGSPFDFMMPQYRQKGTEKQDISSGSGFIVTADGYVVTNKHVVAQDDVDYTVITNDGTKYPAKVIAQDQSNDVAVLKIDGQDFPYLQFGNSDDLKVGQLLIAIGNALGQFSNSVSVGVVSGLSRSIQAGDGAGSSEQLQNVIQTDAAINFGNSGGPLLNLSGQVIGVNVAMAQAENIGFALPSNLISGVVDSVKITGKISRPYLGVRYMPIDSTLKAKNNLPVDFGALVRRGQTGGDLAVIPGSPADKAGIEENDIILEVDGQKIDADHDLSGLIGQKHVGDQVKIKLLHDGEAKTVDVTLDEHPQ